MQTIVGVLRGGPSRAHELSLRTGAAIIADLPEDRFAARDIYISKGGEWHDRGKPISPERILRQIDVALIGLHGEYGENGEMQRFLERFGVPYAGADSFGSHLSMHKLMAKERAREAGILVPESRYVERAQDAEAAAREIIRALHQPVVVKPVGWSSSIGVSLVGGYAPLLSAIEALFNEGARGVLVEEYIRGREATVGIVENLRGEALYSLVPVEVVPAEGGFISHEAKRLGTARAACPGNFSRVASEELQSAARALHRALGLRHYSQSDFIVSPRGVYYLETNALPELGQGSLMRKSLAAVGVSPQDFMAHLVNLALSR